MVPDMKSYLTELPLPRYIEEFWCCRIAYIKFPVCITFITDVFYPYLLGVMQQPMMQQYKISQNQVHGSPATNYQQTTVPQSPSG